MCVFPGAERYGQVELGQFRVQHRAAVGIDAAGQVDGDGMVVALAQRRQQREQLAGNRARQADPEQAIHQNVGTRQRFGDPVDHFAAECRARRDCGGGFGWQRSDHADGGAQRMEVLRDDITVAAVVARAAQHGDFAAGGHAVDIAAGAVACGVHQRFDGGATGDQCRFGVAHLGDGQDLSRRGVTWSILHYMRPYRASSFPRTRESRLGAWG